MYLQTNREPGKTQEHVLQQRHISCPLAEVSTKLQAIKRKTKWRK